jgi:succinate dehydrogenase/fumarate reductase-like Fe-S protein
MNILLLSLSCKHCSTKCTIQVAKGAFIGKTTISRVWRFWLSKEQKVSIDFSEKTWRSIIL